MSKTPSDRVAAIAARTARMLGPRAMRGVARINKRLTNPIQRLWAARLKHMAIIEHAGRKSGRCYRTPVMAFVGDGGISVVLNYGANSDWVRNIQAAGSADVEHRGKRYRLTNPRVLSIDSSELPAAVRGVRASAESALHGTLTAHDVRR